MEGGGSVKSELLLRNLLGWAVRTVGVPSEIGTGHFTNISQKR
jgi:hypothetical protein